MMVSLTGKVGREQNGNPINPGTIYLDLLAFVPICVSKGSALLQSALKQANRVESHPADNREVTQYQELTRMIRIPSLAPFIFNHSRRSPLRGVAALVQM